MNIPDHIFESLEPNFWVKILKFFDADSDPGSGICLTLEMGSRMEKIRIRDKHPGPQHWLAAGEINLTFACISF